MFQAARKGALHADVARYGQVAAHLPLPLFDNYQCDLAQPLCQRCFKAGRQCEGYSTYPTFINRGQSGILKRAHLEEARVAYNDSLHESRLSPRPFRTACQTLQEEQLVSIFWEQYVAGKGNGRHSTGDKPAWLAAAISMSDRSGILREGLLAIAWTRAGRRRDDLPCILQGQRCYGNALRMMQRALYEPDLARSDEVLASARCMCLYEAFESTTDSMTSWINQNLGMARIIELRGAENCQDAFPRAVLESMRQNLMIVSLITRTESFLTRDDWRQIPWTGLEKPLEQRLYDHGFTLGSLFHKSDTIITDQTDPGAIQANMFREIRDSYHSLAVLNEELIYKQQAKSGTLEATPLPVITASLFGIDLGFSLFTSILLAQSKQCILEDNKDMVQDFIGYTYEPRRKQLARQIVQHVAKCLETESLSIVTRLVFALNCARFELKESREDEARIKSILAILESENSHRIVGSLRKAGKSILPRIVRSTLTEESNSFDY